MKNLLTTLLLLLSVITFAQDFGEIYHYRKPTALIDGVTAITENSAYITCNISSNGGAILNSQTLVCDTVNDFTSDALIVYPFYAEPSYTGILPATINGLLPCTTYYARFSVTRFLGQYQYDVDNIDYSIVYTFTTECSATIPVVTTTEPMYLSTTSATSGGNVTSDGGANVIARGVCWATHTSPEITDSKTENGSGTGVFTSTMTPLIAGRLYYVRAYATNSVGTAYGEEFAYQGITLPNVYLYDIYNTTASSTNTASVIMKTGNTTLSDKGVVWSESHNPTLSDYSYSNGSGGVYLDQYVSILNGLDENTTYYVKPYATNTVGTYYGNEMSFTTQSLSCTILATLTTNSITNITSDSATSGGNISSDGNCSITARGVCWSTSPNPTISLPTKTNDGTGIGSFSSSITGLTCGATYYVRSYATNAYGTAYGNENIFVPTGNYTVELNKINYVIQWGTTYDATNGSDLSTATSICRIYFNEYYNEAQIETGQYFSEFSVGGILYEKSGTYFCKSSATGYFVFKEALVNSGYIVLMDDGEIQSISSCPASCPSIGDSYQGGIVAYLFQSGDYGYVSGECHGIIVSNNDLADATWGCQGTTINGADYFEIGRAAENTSAIVSGCSTSNIAADLCLDYSNAGYTDWYLPTKNDVMTGLCYLANNSSLFSGYYWTSTEDNSNTATTVSAGTCNGSVGANKSETKHVRAVRYF